MAINNIPHPPPIYNDIKLLALAYPITPNINNITPYYYIKTLLILYK